MLRTRPSNFVLTLLFLVAALSASPAQTFTTLYTFDSVHGAFPALAALVQGTDGNLYGTTRNGGAIGAGTVFKITPSGTLTTVYSFCIQTSCTDGSLPYAGVVLGTNGNFYGLTYSGGANNFGTIFEITPAGKLTTLHSFDNTDGANSFNNALTLSANGNFYGLTSKGGANGSGEFFEITPAGKFTALYSFLGGASGSQPSGTLVQGSDGNFYGTTYSGGSSGFGTVFKISPVGKLTILYSFSNSDGANPYTGLVDRRILDVGLT